MTRNNPVKRDVILYLLYDNDARDILSAMDSETIAKKIDMPYEAVRQELVYLEEKELIVNKHRQMRVRIFCTTYLSAKGVDWVENFHSQQLPILFLSADPTDLSKLRLGEEFREIQKSLQMSKLRDKFELHIRLSVQPEDITQALLDINPSIVHFSGHGTSTGALCLEDQIGKMHPIQPDVLADLFQQFTDVVNCIVLNACYSEIQAQIIVQHVQYVIGMSKEIDDKIAIAFSIGFYQAIGAGRTIEEAYRLGCTQIRIRNLPDYLLPTLVIHGSA